MEQELTAMSPIIQFGFAGFSMLLLGLIFWLVRKVLEVLQETNTVIQANTSAIQRLVEGSEDELSLMRKIYDRLISRPCQLEKYKEINLVRPEGD